MWAIQSVKLPHNDTVLTIQTRQHDTICEAASQRYRLYHTMLTIQTKQHNTIFEAADAAFPPYADRVVYFIHPIMNPLQSKSDKRGLCVNYNVNKLLIADSQPGTTLCKAY